jgi:hypothetical protein
MPFFFLQVRVGRDVASEHIIFDVWEWRKGNEGQQLVSFAASVCLCVCVSLSPGSCGGGGGGGCACLCLCLCLPVCVCECVCVRKREIREQFERIAHMKTLRY